MEQGPQQGQQFIRPLCLIPQLLAAAYPISVYSLILPTSHLLIQELLLALRAFSHHLLGLVAHTYLPPHPPLYSFQAQVSEQPK